MHEIEVQPTGIDPDPKVIRRGDVIAWNFDDLVDNDVTEVKTVEDAKSAESKSNPVIPRLAVVLHGCYTITGRPTRNNFDSCLNFK